MFILEDYRKELDITFLKTGKTEAFYHWNFNKILFSESDLFSLTPH